MNKLRLGVRLMLAIVAIPGLFLSTVMGIDLLYYGSEGDFDLFSLVYGVAALYLLYVAFTGKPPIALEGGETNGDAN